MGWETSDRRKDLPKDWNKIVKRIKKRDGDRCMATNANTGERCFGPADEVDHKKGRTNHNDYNLQSLCHHHHVLKTARESAAAEAKKRREIASRYQREC